MSAFSVTLIGDLFEVLGVFFLSVEAIKLPNLYKLRDHFLLPLDHALRPGTIYPLKTKWTPAELRSELVAVRHFFVSHYVMGLAMVALIALLTARTSPATVAFLTRLLDNRLRLMIAAIVFAAALWPLPIVLFATRGDSRTPPVIAMVLTTLTMFPVGLVPMALGEACHQGFRVLVRATLRLLQFIDEGTPTGTIGLLGFFVVCLGKAFQLIAHTFH